MSRSTRYARVPWYVSATSDNVLRALLCHNLTMSAVDRHESLPPETIAAVRGRAAGRSSTGSSRRCGRRARSTARCSARPRGSALRLGIEQAIRAFLDAVERGERPARGTRPTSCGGGSARRSSRPGRSLDDLRAAFRTGIAGGLARGRRGRPRGPGVSAPAAIALAEAIFVYGDELATDVVEGYLRIQSDEAGERERRRRRLAALLLDPAGHDPEASPAPPSSPSWPLPRALAVRRRSGGDDPAALARRLDLDVLAGADGDGAWLVLPDPDGPGRRAARRPRARGGAGGRSVPTVALAEAHRSLRWARLALELVERGAIRLGPVRAADHLATLHPAPGPRARRRSSRGRAWRRSTTCRPASASACSRRWRRGSRTSATPRRSRGAPRPPADRPLPHRQAPELLGDAMDTADGRFELELALRISESGK